MRKAVHEALLEMWPEPVLVADHERLESFDKRILADPRQSARLDSDFLNQWR